MKYEGLLFLCAIVSFAAAAPARGKKSDVGDLAFDIAGKILDFARNRKPQHLSSLNQLANLEGFNNDITVDVPDGLSHKESSEDLNRRISLLRKLSGPRVGNQEDTLQDTAEKTDIGERMAMKESLRDYYTTAKKLIKAYKAFQDGVATKEDLQRINEDIHQSLQQLNAAMAAEDEPAEGEAALSSIPGLLYTGYKAYKLYKNHSG